MRQRSGEGIPAADGAMSEKIGDVQEDYTGRAEILNVVVVEEITPSGISATVGELDTRVQYLYSGG